jgi:quercetin dioxygenase-like cupin family protein
VVERVNLQETRKRRSIMARAGDEIVDPNTEERLIFRKTANETNGELLQLDWIGKAGWKAGPLHVHRYQEERFEVISGTLGSHVAGVERIHEVGEVVVAPAGSVHTVWNAGGEEEEVHSLVEFRPALRSETVLETLAGLAQDGKTNKAGIPKNPLRLGLIVHDYEDEIYFAQPPLFVQRMIFGVLAKVGRLLGYRAEYPYPYADRGEEPFVSEGERVSASSGARRGAVGVTVIIVAFLVSFLLWQRIRRSRR